VKPHDKKLAKDRRSTPRTTNAGPHNDQQTRVVSAHPGKGIGREVSELIRQGVRGQELKDEIRRLQQEHRIAPGRFKDKKEPAVDGDDDRTDTGIDDLLDDAGGLDTTIDDLLDDAGTTVDDIEEDLSDLIPQ
jgi:hypothetical protein